MKFKFFAFFLSIFLSFGANSSDSELIIYLRDNDYRDHLNNSQMLEFFEDHYDYVCTHVDNNYSSYFNAREVHFINNMIFSEFVFFVEGYRNTSIKRFYNQESYQSYKLLFPAHVLLQKIERGILNESFKDNIVSVARDIELLSDDFFSKNFEDTEKLKKFYYIIYLNCKIYDVLMNDMDNDLEILFNEHINIAQDAMLKNAIDEIDKALLELE